MPKEQEIDRDRPTKLIESILGDRNKLRAILSQSDETDVVLDEASSGIATLNVGETITFVRTILNGLTRDDGIWNVDRRDGAIELLSVTDLDRIQRHQLLRDYLGAVQTQTADSDPYGSISSLLRAGGVFDEHLPLDGGTRTQIDSAWNKIADYFTGDDKDYIIQEKNNLVNSIPMDIEDLHDHETGRLGQRKQPKFEANEQLLHDKYLEITQKAKNYKLFLWENTPQFRSLCQNHGLALERFWNISDPDKVVQAVQSDTWVESPVALAAFNKALQAETGFDLDNLSPEAARISADEIVKAASNATGEIEKTVRDYGSVIRRFQQLAAVAKNNDPKAQRLIAAQIVNFFQENGVSLTNKDLDSVEATLLDYKVLQTAEIAFTAKQGVKKNAIKFLEDNFGLREVNPDFSFASRQRDDLFLGDLTGDCTAYHLHVGMNAWTVPVWLSNPGFNFYKITSGDQLVAKLGIVLAKEKEGLALVVDSFEVGQDLADEVAAGQQIRTGLQFLRQWGESIGLKKLFVNTLSNSFGAENLFLGMVEHSRTDGLEVLGGLSGVSELRQRLTGQKTEERIYLQTDASSDFGDEEEETESNEGFLTREFEKVISSTLNKAGAEDRNTIETFARSQNWEELFKYVMDLNFPTVSQVMGHDWVRYQTLVDKIEIDDRGNVRPEFIIESESSHTLDRGVKDTMEEYTIEKMVLADEEVNDEEFDKELSEDPGLTQALDVDRLLLIIKLMKDEKLTPEIVLKKLYSQTNIDYRVDTHEIKKLPLRTKLARWTF